MTSTRSIPVRRSGVLRVARMMEKIRVSLCDWEFDDAIQEAANLGLADDIQAAILVLLDAAGAAAAVASGPADDGLVDAHVLDTFYVTFGQRYRTEAHPYLPTATPDGWVRIVAETEADARRIACEFLGERWSFLYKAADFDDHLYPDGELAVIGDE